uniref:kinesin-like protein KIF27 isoform X2 n=1 Tax=Styela clava TaxID=7725 RepID=UPI001939E393|nr:kinesin-like protein KIF27 isoform X2 [Styela clava]
MADDSVNVCVAVRVRPLLPSERLHSHQVCVKKVSNSKNQLLVGKDRSFTFDHLHWWNTKQQDIYKTTVKPLVDGCFQGYNATVFAYGQTGSGKTYTIGGSNPANITRDEQGIIPRAINEMFSEIKSPGRKHIDHAIKVSYVEIYKEEVRDLLEVDLQKCKDVHIREDQNGNTVIIGAREENCSTADEVMSLLQKGSAVRHTGATQMNELSSRSHAIFTIHMIQTWPCTPRPKNLNTNNSNNSMNGLMDSDDLDDEKIQNVMSAKFHFVDLAGSERANRTGNTGERFKESVQINTGLLALGNVISALSDPKKKKIGHVPYRDSKITRVLKDSLGGNARTVMITCISPSSTSFDETLNALKYANRAKNITNKPVVNRDPQQILIEDLQDEIEELKQQLQSRPTTREIAMQKQKILELEVEELQTHCRLYKKHIEEAAKHFKLVCAGKHVNKTHSSNIKKWLESVSKNGLAFSKQNLNASFSASMSRDERIQQELEEYRRTLESDDKVFAAKDAQIDQLGKALSEVQDEIRDREETLQMAEEIREQQGAKLIEQKVIIEELQEEILYMREEFQHLQNPSPSGHHHHVGLLGRAQSVPHPARGAAFSTDSKLLSEEAKRAHSSPPLISAERIMAGFRARNHVIADRIEEEDEVDHRSFGIDGDEPGSDPYNSNQEAGDKSDRSTASRKREAFIQQHQWRIPSARKQSGPSFDQDEKGNIDTELNVLRESTVLSVKRLKDSELRAQNSNNKIRELSINIKMKEELIKDLVRTGHDAEAVNRDYLTRILVLEKEVQTAKRELLDSHKALQNGGSEQELLKLKTDYEQKLKGAKSKVQMLQKKQRETERIATIPSQNKKKIKELEIGIAAMRQMQEDMQKKLKTEQDQKRKLESELSKDQAKIKDLEVKNKNQEKILKRKTQEVAAIQKRLRSAKSISPEEPDDIDEQRRWLDEEVEKALDQQKLLKQLEDALRAREAAVIRREEAIQRRTALETKKMRSSQVISSEALQLASKMASVDQKLSARTQQLRDSLTLTSDRGHQGSSANRQHQLKSAIERLQSEKIQLEEKRRRLEEKLQDGDVLDTQDERELIELDEAVEALTAAIEWQDDTIMRTSTSKDLRESRLKLARERNSGLQKYIKSLSGTEAGMLLTKCFERVIDLREYEQTLESKLTDMEARLNNKDRAVLEAETALNRYVVESDRRLMEMEKQHEKRTQQLIKQLSDPDKPSNPATNDDVLELQSKIQVLEKDLAHYRTTNRDLKKKLREVLADAEIGDDIVFSARSNSESEMRSARKDRDAHSPDSAVASTASISGKSSKHHPSKSIENENEKQRFGSPKRQKRAVTRQSSGDMVLKDPRPLSADLNSVPLSPTKLSSNPNLGPLRRSRQEPHPGHIHPSIPTNSVEYLEYQDLNQNLPSSRSGSGGRRLSPNHSQDPLLLASHPSTNPTTSHNLITASLSVTDSMTLGSTGSKFNPNPMQAFSEKIGDGPSKPPKMDPTITPVRISKKDLKRLPKTEITQRKTSLSSIGDYPQGGAKQSGIHAAGPGPLQDSLEGFKNPW